LEERLLHGLGLNLTVKIVIDPAETTVFGVLQQIVDTLWEHYKASWAQQEIDDFMSQVEGFKAQLAALGDGGDSSE
jgi:uncharacterized protein YcbX